MYYNVCINPGTIVFGKNRKDGKQMKNRMRRIAVLLAAVLCISSVFAGFAMAGDAQTETEVASGDSAGISSGESADSSGESSGESTIESADSAGESTGEMSEEDMAAYQAMMDSLGLTELMEFDWEGFYEVVNERVENGEELTMEEAFPDLIWQFAASMLNPSDGSKEAGYTVDLNVTENEMMMIWIFDDVISEEEAEPILASVKESFESEESMANLKSSMEQMCEPYNIDINKLAWGLIFINGDDSVLYEKVYTYEALTDALAELDDEAQETE